MQLTIVLIACAILVALAATGHGRRGYYVGAMLLGALFALVGLGAGVDVLARPHLDEEVVAMQAIIGVGLGASLGGLFGACFWRPKSKSSTS